MSGALACKALSSTSEDTSKHFNETLAKCFEEINSCLETGKVRDIFDYGELARLSPLKAPMLVMVCLLLYPQAMKQLLDKIAKK